MIAFFKRYSYDCVRMMLNQFAISMFGFALAMTAVKAESDALLMWSSIAAIVFYLVLTYSTAWRVGSSDRLSIRYGKIPFNPVCGLLISLVANAVNFLLAILSTIGFLGEIEILKTISSAIMLLIEGMYQGVLATVYVGGLALNKLWWPYLLLPVPALVASLLGYIAGAKEFRIIKAGMSDLPESDRPTRKEMRERKEQDKKDDR